MVRRNILTLFVLSLLAAPSMGFDLIPWEWRVAAAKSIGCGTEGCADASKTPDAVTAKKVSLTFDDGPNSVITPKILEILEKHGVKAAFFVLGRNVKGNETLLRSMVEKGHIVGAHSWSHLNFWKISQKEIEQQIFDTEQALMDIGIKPVFFRYPHGNSTKTANDLLLQRNYKITGWNVDTCDWGFASNGILPAKTNKICTGVAQSVSDASTYLLKKIKERKGGIVLFHDTSVTTAMNLDRILTALIEDGYEFVSLDDETVFPLLNQR